MLHDSEFMSARDAQCYPDTKFPIQEVQFLKYCHNSHKHNVQFPQTKLLWKKCFCFRCSSFGFL